jgi:hypothetical protein
MSASANYNNGQLAIYIQKAELDYLLTGAEMSIPVLTTSDRLPLGVIDLRLPSDLVPNLKAVHLAYKTAFRQEAAAEHRLHGHRQRFGRSGKKGK